MMGSRERSMSNVKSPLICVQLAPRSVLFNSIWLPT